MKLFLKNVREERKRGTLIEPEHKLLQYGNKEADEKTNKWDPCSREKTGLKSKPVKFYSLSNLFPDLLERSSSLSKN